MKRFLMIPALIIPTVIISLLSCGDPYVIQTMQEQSQTQISCPPEKIEIIQHVTHEDGSATWMALCQGKTYSCQRVAGQEADPQVSCTEMESQMPQ